MVDAERHLEAVARRLTTPQDDAGVVDEHRQLVGGSREGRGKVADRRERRKIETQLFDGSRTATSDDVVDCGRTAYRIADCDDHAGTLPRERDRRLLAQTAVTPGDHHRLALHACSRVKLAAR